MNVIILMHIMLAYSTLLFLGDSNSIYTLQIIATAILIVSECTLIYKLHFVHVIACNSSMNHFFLTSFWRVEDSRFPPVLL